MEAVFEVTPLFFTDRLSILSRAFFQIGAFLFNSLTTPRPSFKKGRRKRDDL